MPNVALVLDISNITCRAYHSVATGKKGQSVLGLSRHRLKSMVTTLLRECDPLRLMGALDSETPSFRHELYPDYKGHRGEKPEELRALLAEAPGLLKKNFGVELYHSPDYEADDVMASIADANLAAEWRTALCTNDRDLLATAYDAGNLNGTYILHNHAGSYHALGPAEVQAKMGVPPHRVALYKAIAGDKGDAIPGIPLLGDVAAKRLANTYPSMTAIFKNLDQLQSSDRKRLEAAGLEYALLMEQLTTLRFDVPIRAI